MSPSRRNSILAVPLVPVIVGKKHKLYPTQMCFLLLTTGKSYSHKAAERATSIQTHLTGYKLARVADARSVVINL